MRRTIMIEGTCVPLEAECTDEGWNGFHVPILTCEELSDYLAACQRNDPNGEYDERPFVKDIPGGAEMRLPFWEDPFDSDQDDVWAWSGIDYRGRYTFAVDGLVWVDYVSGDDY